MLNLREDPHRRLNVLTGEWVLVSPHRTSRPWQGAVEKTAPTALPEYDPTCYLCPGNSRAGGVRNPDYKSTFVFDNDFAALKPDTPIERWHQSDLLVAEGEPGRCRVICFSPRHDLTLSKMQDADIAQVVELWSEQFTELGQQTSINYVQIFENRGAMMGASNPHPHCQIWATSDVPVEPAKEQEQQQRYWTKHSKCLLCDYVRLEREIGTRIVFQTEHFTALVPFWAVWPFETLVVGTRHVSDLGQLSTAEKLDLAHLLRGLTGIYDGVFETSFPYTMGFHQRPTDGEAHDEWHLHAHFYPPLLRSATIRKFMVGFELLANPQRDITPEAAAERLRDLVSQTGGQR
jgi:UDPglucose--hexose-1-phosphate uridylyltransferase